MVMELIARIIGVSLLTAGLGTGLGYAFVMQHPNRSDYDWSFLFLLLACVGGVIGAIAGAAREIVTAQRQPPSG